MDRIKVLIRSIQDLKVQVDVELMIRNEILNVKSNFLKDKNVGRRVEEKVKNLQDLEFEIANHFQSLILLYSMD